MKIVQITPLNFSWNANGEVICKSGFKVNVNSIREVELVAGKIGEPFPVAVDSEKEGLVRDATLLLTEFSIAPDVANVWVVLFVGRRCAVEAAMVGGVTGVTLPGGGMEKKAEFILPVDFPESAKPKQGEEALWAGEGFFCTSCETLKLKDGEIRLKVTAKELSIIRMISFSTRESHLGYNALGTQRKERVWSSIWSVPAGLLESFVQTPGADAASWAEPNTVVSRLEKNRISEVEYEITIEARSIYGNNNQSLLAAGMDDRSDFASRVDIDVSFSELRITATEAGFYWNSMGIVAPLIGWGPARCPIIATSGYRGFDRPLKTMTVRESRYYKGSTGENLKAIAKWRTSDPLFSGKVGKYDGDWLKSEIRAVDISDNRGKIWTRIDRYFRLPPDNESWNREYWRGR